MQCIPAVGVKLYLCPSYFSFYSPGSIFRYSAFLLFKSRVFTCTSYLSFYSPGGIIRFSAFLLFKFVHVPITSHSILRVALLYPPEASGGYFGLASATPPLPPHVERFLALTL